MDPTKKEKISSLFLLLFSAFICFFSYQLSIGSLKSPSGGFFPFYLGIILGLLSIHNFIKAMAKTKKEARAIKTSDDGIHWKNIILTVVVLFLYPLLLGTLGFPISTFIFTAFFLRFIGLQRWWIVLGTGGIVAIICYFVFYYWLKIQFPPGIFGV
jgi:hypothetical protein